VWNRSDSGSRTRVRERRPGHGPGEFAVRGSLLDVFPMGAESPLRIDLFGTEIEAIRRFDPETQRSLDSVDSVRMLPAREVPLDPESIKGFRRRYRTRFEGDRPCQASTAASAKVWRPRASSSICRCSSIPPRHCLITCRAMR